VVDRRGQLVGIVTDRDICLAPADTPRNALNIYAGSGRIPGDRERGDGRLSQGVADA
jgi:hypothetical protein